MTSIADLAPLPQTLLTDTADQAGQFTTTRQRGAYPPIGG